MIFSNKNKKIKIAAFLIINFIYMYFIVVIKIIYSYFKTQIGIYQIESYYIFCNHYKFNKIKKYINKNLNPKISIISPIYNRERYLYRFLLSIQYQNFVDLEIILIDDFSKDCTVKIIEEYQKIDKRIILLKNKINKGTFFSRNLGVQYSKAKYVIIPDPDDLINKNILNICYKYSEKYKYEMIRFNIYSGNGNIMYYKFSEEFGEKPLNQPNLAFNIFYGNNELEMTDYHIYNKFIKKEVFIKSLNSLNNFFSNIYMTLMEDQLFNYILYRTAKSFYYIKIIGYYYNRNSISITKNSFKLNKIKLVFFFIYIKLIFEYSKKTKYEKDMANFLFSRLYKNVNIEKEFPSSISKEKFFFYYEILNMYINCKFISNEIKNIFITFKKKNRKKI